MSDETHFYVYEVRDNAVIYDRTMPSEKYAKQRVEELRKRGVAAVYTEGTTIKGSYY